MKRLLPFVVTVLALLFPALASAQSEQGKITITQVEHCTLKVTYKDNSFNDVPVNSGDMVNKNTMLTLDATVDAGYFLSSYVVNGKDEAPYASGTAMVFVKGDTEISAKVIKQEDVSITILQPEHGTITVKDMGNKQAVVNNGDNVPTGHQLRVEVVPEAGYQINHWLINDEQKDLANYNPNATLVKVVGATKITAVMEPIPAPSKLTLAVDPAEGATLEAHERVSYGNLIKDLDKVTTGSKVCLVLKPKEGYSIKHWLVDDVVTPPDADEYYKNRFTFVMDKDKTITAVLNVPTPPAGDYLITMEIEGKGTLTAKDGGGNTVNSGDKVKKAAYLTFTATPTEGYEVDNWYVNGALDFTNSGQTTKEIEIYEDTSVKVVFKQVQMYTVTYSAGENGTLSASYQNDDYDDVALASGDKVKAETTVTFTATPNEGYLVDKWLIDGEVDSEYGDQTEIGIYMESDKEVKVLFKQKPVVLNGHVVKFSAEGDGSLTAKVGETKLTSGDQVEEGKEIVFTAKPGFLMNVDQWIVNGTEIDPSAEDPNVLKVTMGTEDIEVKVSFSTPKKTITFSAGENGSIVAKFGDKTLTSPAKVKSGVVVTLIATPNEGYEIEGWYKNGATVADPTLGTQTEIEEQVWEDVTILVKFKEVVHYTVTYEAGENGTLTATVEEGEETKDLASGGKVVAGTFVTFTATPAEGYEVDEWKVDGTVDAEHAKSLELRKEVTADTKVTVSFKKKPEPVKEFTIAVNAVEPAEAGTLTVTDDKGAAVLTGAKVAQGTMLTITAEAKDKYEFKNFTINKKEIGTDAEGVIKVIDKKKYTYKLEVKGSTVIGATFSKTTSADDILAQTKEFAVVNGSIYCPGARMIALYTMDGALVRTIEAEVMEVRDLAAGNYLVIATNREGVALQKKIVL